MDIEFSYNGFVGADAAYPDSFDMKSTIDNAKLQGLKQRHSPEHNFYANLMFELKHRTTDDYYNKVERVQTAARRHALKVFPPYELYMPETIAEDWLSMVDWHKAYGTRDHSLHQPLTTYIVQELLGRGNAAKSLDLPNGKRLLDYCAELMIDSPKMEFLRRLFPNNCNQFNNMDHTTKLRWARNLFYEAAVMSALFHDIGYPWQYLGRLYEHISVAELDDILKYKVDGVEMQTYLNSHLLSVPYYGYSPFIPLQENNDYGNAVPELMKFSFDKTHGVPGAVSFLKFNEKIRKPFDPTSLMSVSCNLILEWAAVGIMMHDVAKLYRKYNYQCFRLDFEIDPLSCLVAMADVLEEFERPSAEFWQPLAEYDENGKEVEKHVNLNYTYSCLSTRLVLENQELHIEDTYYVQPKAAVLQHRKEELKEYFNLQDGFINLRSWGINNYSYGI